MNGILTLVRASLALGLVVLVGAVLAPVQEAVADASEGGQCDLHDELSVERQLRRLSLDLRGFMPTVDEYAAVEGQSSVPESVIDDFIATDAFRLQVRRYHESILWTNPRGVTLINNNRLGTRTLSPGNPVWLCLLYTSPSPRDS